MNRKSEGWESPACLWSGASASVSRPWLSTFLPTITGMFWLAIDLLWLCSDWCHLLHCGKIPGASQIKTLKESMWEATDNLCQGEKCYSQQANPPRGCGLRPLQRTPALRWNGNVSYTHTSRTGKGLEATDCPRLPPYASSSPGCRRGPQFGLLPLATCISLHPSTVSSLCPGMGPDSRCLIDIHGRNPFNKYLWSPSHALDVGTQ